MFECQRARVLSQWVFCLFLRMWHSNEWLVCLRVVFPSAHLTSQWPQVVLIWMRRGRNGMVLVFSSVLLVEGLTRCHTRSLPAESAVFWCQKQAWQEWHSRIPHHVARAQPVLCMLNWQLKSSATTSPRPLIRESLLPCSLYPVSAGNPFVYGILEDCSDCNRGSFISAGPGGGTTRIPSHLYGLGYRSSSWALSRTAGAVRWALALFGPDRTDEPLLLEVWRVLGDSRSQPPSRKLRKPRFC